jgi:hypothetical protein
MSWFTGESDWLEMDGGDIYKAFADVYNAINERLEYLSLARVSWTVNAERTSIGGVYTPVGKSSSIDYEDLRGIPHQAFYSFLSPIRSKIVDLIRCGSGFGVYGSVPIYGWAKTDDINSLTDTLWTVASMEDEIGSFSGTDPSVGYSSLSIFHAVYGLNWCKEALRKLIYPVVRYTVSTVPLTSSHWITRTIPACSYTTTFPDPIPAGYIYIPYSGYGGGSESGWDNTFKSVPTACPAGGVGISAEDAFDSVTSPIPIGPQQGYLRKECSSHLIVTEYTAFTRYGGTPWTLLEPGFAVTGKAGVCVVNGIQYCKVKFQPQLILPSGTIKKEMGYFFIEGENCPVIAWKFGTVEMSVNGGAYYHASTYEDMTGTLALSGPVSVLMANSEDANENPFNGTDTHDVLYTIPFDTNNDHLIATNPGDPEYIGEETITVGGVGRKSVFPPTIAFAVVDAEYEYK